MMETQPIIEVTNPLTSVVAIPPPTIIYSLSFHHKRYRGLPDIDDDATKDIRTLPNYDEMDGLYEEDESTDINLDFLMSAFSFRYFLVVLESEFGVDVTVDGTFTGDRNFGLIQNHNIGVCQSCKVGLQVIIRWDEDIIEKLCPICGGENYAVDMKTKKFTKEKCHRPEYHDPEQLKINVLLMIQDAQRPIRSNKVKSVPVNFDEIHPKLELPSVLAMISIGDVGFLAFFVNRFTNRIIYDPSDQCFKTMDCERQGENKFIIWTRRPTTWMLSFISRQLEDQIRWSLEEVEGRNQLRKELYEDTNEITTSIYQKAINDLTKAFETVRNFSHIEKQYIPKLKKYLEKDKNFFTDAVELFDLSQ